MPFNLGYIQLIKLQNIKFNKDIGYNFLFIMIYGSILIGKDTYGP